MGFLILEGAWRFYFRSYRFGINVVANSIETEGIPCIKT